MDNDPADRTTDPSNRDANKGLVTSSDVPYAVLLEGMRDLNTRAYALRDHLAPPRTPATGAHIP
jgi:hypothetical protein